MADYEIERERIVERPMGRRTVVEHRGGGYGWFGNPVGAILAALVVVLLLLLVLGAFV